LLPTISLRFITSGRYRVLPDRLRSTGQSREADRHHSLPVGQAVLVHGGESPFGGLIADD